jgi:hypothetical protein
MRRSALTFLTCSLLAAGSPALARELAPRLAIAARAEQIAAARIQRPATLLGRLDRLGEPFSVNATALFPLFAPGFLRSSASRELDLAWPVDFLLLAPAGSPVRFAYTAGTRNPEAFLAGLGTAGGTADGIRSYRSPGGMDYFALLWDEEVLVTDRRELALAVQRAHPRSEPAPAGTAALGDVQIELQVSRLLTIYAEGLEMAKADFFQELESLHGQPGISPKEMRTFYAAYFLIFEALGRQTGTLELGLTFDGPDLLVRSRAEPVQGTALARFLAAQGQAAEMPLAHVPADAVGAATLSMSPTPELAMASLVLLDPLTALSPRRSGGEAGGFEPPPAAAHSAGLLAMYQALYQSLGPQHAALLLPGLPGRPGKRTVYYFDYAEPEQFVPRLQALLLEVLPSLVAFYRDLGWGFDLWLAQSPPSQTLPGTWQLEARFTGLSEVQRKIFDELYGGPQIRAYLLVVGQRVLAVTGPDAPELLREWESRLKAAPPAAARPPGPMPASGHRVLTGFLDLPAYLRQGLDVLPPEQIAQARQAVEAYLRTPQKLFYAASTDGRTLGLEVRYPIEATLRAYKGLP